MRSEFNVSALFWLPLGFKIDPIFIAHSGARYPPVTGFDTQGDGNEGNDRAILDGRVASRNSLRQSAFYGLDVRVARDITLPGEGHYLDVFMDVFNLTAAQNLNFGRMDQRVWSGGRAGPCRPAAAVCAEHNALWRHARAAVHRAASRVLNFVSINRLTNARGGDRPEARR